MDFRKRLKYWWYLRGGEEIVKVALAIVMFLILGLVVFATSGCDAKATAEPGASNDQPAKSAEQPPEPAVPDIEIIAINEDKVYAIYISDKFWAGTYWHYKTTTPLIKELAKLGEKYEIKSIEIQLSMGRSRSDSRLHRFRGKEKIENETPAISRSI